MSELRTSSLQTFLKIKEQTNCHGSKNYSLFNEWILVRTLNAFRAWTGTTMFPMHFKRSASSGVKQSVSQSSTGTAFPGFHGLLKSMSALKRSWPETE